MLKLFKHFKQREWLLVLVAIVFIVGQVWLDLTLPDYMSEITKLVQTPNSKMSDIWLNGAYMLMCALGSAALAVVVGFLAARLAATFSKRLRASVFEKVESFSMEEMQKFSTSSLITRSTNDITQVQMLIAMGLQVLIKAPILAVWAILKITNKSWQWSAATAIAVAVLVVMIMFIVVFAVPKFKIIQGLTDNLNKVTRENLTGIRVVRAYNAETFEQNKFGKANQQLTKTNLFTNRMMAIMQPGMNVIMGGLNLSIYFIGAFLIEQASLMNKITLFSDMVVFSAYAMQVVMAFIMMTMIFIMLPRASVSAKRILEVLNTQSKIADGNQSPTSELTGVVEFKNVSFRYPDADEYVLKNITFTAQKGQTVAFIGSTGSGKSTLINLIPRFYDVSEGELLIDGINVKHYKQTDLHNKIGYIPQKPVLFSGTIESNLTFGSSTNGKPSEEDIKQALSVSQSHFVNRMEQGLSSQVNESGTNLSGGQKQRLSIARAVARKPEIFIFDDSFSALDYKTDKNLREQLKNKVKGVTNFIVAARIGTIKDADQIVVLENGEMVGIGTHKELLKNCQVYQEIAYSQLSKEELENE